MGKKVYRLVIFACLCIFLFSLYGCSSKKEEPIGTSFQELLNRIGEISEVNEGELYDFYRLYDEDSINEIIGLITDAIVEEIQPQEDDFKYLYEGAPKDSSTLGFVGSESELLVYVNDKKMKYDLVCQLYTSETEWEWYCYSLTGEIYRDIKKIVHKGEKEPLVKQEAESDLLSQDTTQQETEYITGDDYDSLVSHFEIVKEDREGGFVYVCVDGMNIYKYTVEGNFFDAPINYYFEISEDKWGDKDVNVFLVSDETRRYIGRMNYEEVNNSADKRLVSFGGFAFENANIREEIEYDTSIDGYVKDFNPEEGSIKIDIATGMDMSPSGGIRLTGNDGVFEEFPVSPNARFELFWGQGAETTVKGFKYRTEMDKDSIVGYTIYLKGGDVVGIVEVPSA